MTKQNVISKLMSLGLAKEILETNEVKTPSDYGFIIQFKTDSSDEKYLVTYIESRVSLFFYNSNDEYEVDLNSPLGSLEKSLDFMLILHKTNLKDKFLLPIKEVFKKKYKKKSSPTHNDNIAVTTKAKKINLNKVGKESLSKRMEERITEADDSYLSKYDFIVEEDTLADDTMGSDSFSSLSGIEIKSHSRGKPTERVKPKKKEFTPQVKQEKEPKEKVETVASGTLYDVTKVTTGSGTRLVKKFNSKSSLPTPRVETPKVEVKPEPKVEEKVAFKAKTYNRTYDDQFSELVRFVKKHAQQPRDSFVINESLAKYSDGLEALFKVGLTEDQIKDDKFINNMVNRIIKFSK